MNLLEAKKMAEEEMKKHGLLEWSFSFDNAIERFGSCRLTSKKISLSKKLIELNSIERVRNTLLHEIAHALAPHGL